MSDKFLYQNARVKSMEKTLFTAQSVSRLSECSDTHSAWRVLVDLGFGTGAKDGDFDGMFAIEEENAVRFLHEFNVDGALDMFLAQYDYLNLKAAYKAHLTGKQAISSPSGKYDRAEMIGWFEDGAEVPKQFAELVKTLKGLKSPSAIDCQVDKAMYAHIFSLCRKKNAVKEYFVRKVDLQNISAFVRCKRLEIDKKGFEQNYIAGGELDFLADIYEQSIETFKERCVYTPYRDAVMKLVDDGNLVAFETETDNTLLKIFKDRKDELFEVYPIVAFYLAKLTQIRIAKLIVAGIKNGVDMSRIKERMRELYA